MSLFRFGFQLSSCLRFLLLIIVPCFQSFYLFAAVIACRSYVRCIVAMHLTVLLVVHSRTSTHHHSVLHSLLSSFFRRSFFLSFFITLSPHAVKHKSHSALARRVFTDTASISMTPGVTADGRTLSRNRFLAEEILAWHINCLNLDELQSFKHREQ